MSGRRGGGIVEATVFALAGVAILIGLGIWQLDRKVWKENLIATITARIERAPQPLPAPADWARLTPVADEYRHVTFPAEFLPGQEALVYTAGSAFRPDVHGAGYWVFAPARLAGGSIVVINRGFVPADRKDAAARGQGAPQKSVDIVGVMRWPDQPGLFTPQAEPQNNVWYLRDSTAIAAAKTWNTSAPFYIEQESPAPPGDLPKPGKLTVALPDNHLQYAITWFALALGLTGVYVTWLTGRLRRA
ncbi:MAG TPA: SURF1 family protein [Pseudolabrys sp.]|nr:SURF1 family protein [Pseudolabrys sp.]